MKIIIFSTFIAIEANNYFESQKARKINGLTQSIAVFTAKIGVEIFFTEYSRVYSENNPINQSFFGCLPLLVLIPISKVSK
jgi:membrane protein insertase Oxa1/YidC/SpoIIIJ